MRSEDSTGISQDAEPEKGAIERVWRMRIKTGSRLTIRGGRTELKKQRVIGNRTYGRSICTPRTPSSGVTPVPDPDRVWLDGWNRHKGKPGGWWLSSPYRRFGCQLCRAKLRSYPNVGTDPADHTCNKRGRWPGREQPSFEMPTTTLTFDAM